MRAAVAEDEYENVGNTSDLFVVNLFDATFFRMKIAWMWNGSLYTSSKHGKRQFNYNKKYMAEEDVPATTEQPQESQCPLYNSRKSFSSICGKCMQNPNNHQRRLVT